MDQPEDKSNKYTVLAMMSGTSLDGVDLSLATYYQKKDGGWAFDAIVCNTYPYEKNHIDLIHQMQNKTTTYVEFRQLELAYSQVLVEIMQNFITENFLKKQNIDLVSIHGHTIFHTPSSGLTVQASNLQYIAAKLKMNVVGNFRQLDVCRGGQGAPLAPFGQQMFGDNFYLNLGGIANIGFGGKGFDIVFCNIILNKFSEKIAEQPFDRDGNIGKQGQVIENFLKQLADKFHNDDKHSLARQEVQQFLEQIKKSEESKIDLKNKMRTFYQFIANQIIKSIQWIKKNNEDFKDNELVYCTGGGAYNNFLLNLLNKNQSAISFIQPDPLIVQFKEALIFGLLAVKFMVGQKNCQNGVGGQLIKGAL